MRAGITPVWASEIEKAPISITKRHFPEMTHLGDITKIKGSDIAPVDVVTFGSPCQDLSICGTRYGISGARSGLFIEAIRIIKEMRYATNNPTFIVWENVPGAFSTNKGEDFRAIIEEIARIAGDSLSIPRPPWRGKLWDNAGTVLGKDWSIAWRVLDAQYWGVPQRRRRIFLIADFGGQRAGEILFERESLSGYFAQDGTPQEEYTAGIEGSADSEWPKVAGTLTTQSNDSLFVDRVSHPRTAGTLCASGAGLNRPAGSGNETDFCVVTFSFQRSDQYSESEVSGTLLASSYKRTDNLVNPEDGGVRRFTPTECERLQGFPDGWTAYGHDGEPLSDTQRYKALGNSVAIPCVTYILNGIAETYMRERQ
jgi:DNA (cytosine-5)-methyltransferase 1